jgi:hypothetical protein
MLKKRCDGIANGVKFIFRPKVYQNSKGIAQVHVAITLRGVSDCDIPLLQNKWKNYMYEGYLKQIVLLQKKLSRHFLNFEITQE